MPILFELLITLALIGVLVGETEKRAACRREIENLWWAVDSGLLDLSESRADAAQALADRLRTSRREPRAVVSVCRGIICLKRLQPAEAETYFRAALAVLGSESHALTVPILTLVARACTGQTKLEEAEAAVHQGLRLARATPGRGWLGRRNTPNQLTIDQTRSPGWRLQSEPWRLEAKLLEVYVSILEKRRNWKVVEQIGHRLRALAEQNQDESRTRVAIASLGSAAMRQGQQRSRYYATPATDCYEFNR